MSASPRRVVVLVGLGVPERAVLAHMAVARGYQLRVVKSADPPPVPANDDGVDVVVLGPGVEHYASIAAAEAIREHGLGVAILRVEHKTHLTREIELLHAGVDDVVSSTPHARLLARFESALRRGSGSYAGTAKFGPLTIHHDLRSAEISGRLLPLTPAEFDVLSYLAARTDRVVPTRELCDAVLIGGALDELSTRNRIKRHVSRIRDKLGRARDLLWTVRGSGYRLAGE